MHIKASSLDDILRQVFSKLLKSKIRVNSSKGWNVELTGVVLELTDPRSRLSRTDTKSHAISGFGEWLWYASRSDRYEPMDYYLQGYRKFAEEDGSVHGAYGPRIFGGNPSQYEQMVNLLRRKPESRQAVIQLFDRSDILNSYEDVPCTCTIQFTSRDGILHAIVHMRSNDGFKGFPHDVFSFTILQETLARDLGFGLGTYKHLVGSLHLYDEDRAKAQRYLDEGYQRTRAMPEMPLNSQWPDIEKLVAVEARLREQGSSAVPDAIGELATMSDFWGDAGRLLAIYALIKSAPELRREALRQISEIRNSMSNDFYTYYIRKKAQKLSDQVKPLDLLNALEQAAK